MKLLLQLFLVVVFTIQISSCEKDFVVKEQEHSKRMTVNCAFNNYQTFFVYVTQSSSVSGNTSLLPIADALVELFENDSLIEILSYIPTDTANTFGSYQSHIYPSPENKYSLKITHPLYGVVNAEDVMVTVPVVNSFELKSYGTFTTENLVKFNMQLKDDAATEDFYRINIWQWGTQHILVDSIWQNVEFSSSAKPELITPLNDTVRDNGYFLLFSDKNFNGTNKDIQLQFRGVDSSFAEHETVTVELVHISKAHYEYYRTLELYQHAGYGAEPVHVYNNINNGYGIFMSSAINSMTVQVK